MVLKAKFDGLEFLKSAMPLKFVLLFYDFVRLNLMAEKAIKFIKLSLSRLLFFFYLFSNFYA